VSTLSRPTIPLQNTYRTLFDSGEYNRAINKLMTISNYRGLLAEQAQRRRIMPQARATRCWGWALPATSSVWLWPV
jgi:hypothetical protein